MTQRLVIHPINPQLRLVRQAAASLDRGGVVVYPTDSTYALGCKVAEKAALESIQVIRGLEPDHLFTLACRDLAEVARYARVSDPVFRMLRANTPGPYTFVLPATKLVPKRLMHPKRRTIGVRIPAQRIAQMLLGELGEALMSTTLILAGEDDPLGDPDEIYAKLARRIDILIDAGPGGLQPTTVVDLTGDEPVVLREGCGDPSPFR